MISLLSKRFIQDLSLIHISAISKKILEEGTPARDAYKEFLKTGSSDYPVELLKIAGVDMSSKEPVVMAMETFKKLVDEFEKLL